MLFQNGQDLFSPAHQSDFRTKCLGCFRTGTSELWQQFFCGVNDTHTASATTGSCLQHNWITTGFGKLYRFFFCLNCLFHTRNGWNTYRMCYNLGLDLIAQTVHHLGSRSDEFDAVICTGLGKFHVFSQETITRMDCIYALGLCQSNNFINPQVSTYRCLALANLVSFVGFGSEQCVLILFRLNRYSTDAQFSAGTKYSDCDFASVCYQYSFEFFNLSHVLSPKKLLYHMYVHLWIRY